MSNLLSMYQEVHHYQNELMKTNDDDVFKLLDVVEYLREKWHAAETELEGAIRIQTSFQSEIGELRVQSRNLNSELRECRSQVAALLTTNEQIGKEKNVLQSQFDMVRDLLRDEAILAPEHRKRLAFLDDQPKRGVAMNRDGSCSAMLDSVDYDRTDDSLEEQEANSPRRKRSGGLKRSISLTRLVPSAPGLNDMDEQTPRKRSRDDMHLAVNGHSAAINNQNGRRSPLNRSFSERNVGTLQLPGGARSMKSVTDLATLSPATSATAGRRHTFMSKTTLKAEFCDVCNKRMAFGSTMWRCDTCKTQSHAECRERAVLPCVPRGTPANKNQRGKLVEFVSKGNPPMIPSIIIHCVNELERRGLSSLGLYRVPGSETQVSDLVEKMAYGRGTPNLRLIADVNVLAGCVKKFLLQLAEPLIPPTSLNEFIKAGEIYQSGADSSSQLHKSISELPIPNRDTLAFLMLHFNRVAEFAHENKMTKENLAAILGPTLMGTPSFFDYGMMAPEVAKLTSVVNALFQFPPEYWSRYLAKSECGPILGNPAAMFCSPSVFENAQAASSSLLGPMPTYNTGTLTPTNYGYKSRTANRKFFNHPWK